VGIDYWRTLDLAAASVDDHMQLYQEEMAQVVVNCTGSTGGEAREMVAANVTLVETLVDALRRLRSIRLVHLGSAAEYGQQPTGVPIPESATPCPVGQYGQTKLAATELITAAADTGILDATVLRVFNPVGSGAPVNSLAGRVALAIRDSMVAEVDTIRLGPLDASRDFVAADDVARAVGQAVYGLGVPHVVNVGSGHATASRALVHQLAAVAGFAGAIIEDSPGSTRSATVDWQAADTTLLRCHLGDQPSIPLVDSLSQLWESLCVSL
jgi:NDP-hexose 4-ketoreductase